MNQELTFCRKMIPGATKTARIISPLTKFDKTTPNPPSFALGHSMQSLDTLQLEVMDKISQVIRNLIQFQISFSQFQTC